MLKLSHLAPTATPQTQIDWDCIFLHSEALKLYLHDCMHCAAICLADWVIAGAGVQVYCYLSGW